MVKVVGFTIHEEQVIKGMMSRFGADNYSLAGLRHIAKTEMPGYNGKVIPARVGLDDRIEMTMYLSSCSPFTVAHELAHVADISVRRKETLDNLSHAMPTHWHLAHRMSSEYYANRVACDYSEEPHIFEAFQNDVNGLKVAAFQNDWASFLIYYSLLLGIMHGMKRHDVEPLKLLKDAHVLPDSVIRGIEGFKAQAAEFFDNHATNLQAA